MRYRAVAFSVAVAALLAVPAVAEEVIYFTNGSSLAIRGHKVTDGMIHVDMGDDAFIGFPMSMVDRIEEAGKDGYVPPSSALGLKKNQMVESPSASGQRVTSRYNRDPQANRNYADKRGQADPVEVDENGMAFVRAYPNHRSGARSQLKVTGRSVGGVMNVDPRRGLVGTRRLGTSQLIGEVNPEQSKAGVTLMRPNLSLDTPYQPPRAVEAPGAAGSEEGNDDGASSGDSSGSE